MDFSEYLRHIRHFHGLTQAVFAETLGYKQSTVSDIENKRKTASNKFKAALARMYPRTESFERFLIEIKQGG